MVNNLIFQLYKLQLSYSTWGEGKILIIGSRFLIWMSYLKGGNPLFVMSQVYIKNPPMGIQLLLQHWLIQTSDKVDCAVQTKSDLSCQYVKPILYI